MTKLSRRSLARWASDELIAGRPAPQVAGALAAAMVRNGLRDQAGFLINDILWELEQRKELAVVKVTSAHQLSREVESALKAQIKKITGAADIAMETTVDKSVIGGVRAETSSRAWDQTVSKKLTELREVF